MLNSGVIDVGIALVYVYVFVLVSSLVSALNELVAGVLKQRAKALWHRIGELIRSDSLRDTFYAHPMIKSVAPPVSGARLTPIRMAGPSYIPAKVFALHAKIDVESTPGLDKTRDLLRATRLPVGWPDGVPVIQRPFDWDTFDGTLLFGWLLSARTRRRSGERLET